MDNQQTQITLPVVAVHDTVVFPGTVVPLRIGRPYSLRAVERAQAAGGRLLLLAERGGDGQRGREIEPEQLHRVGTVGQVVQVLRLPDGTYQTVVQGLARAQVDDLTLRDGMIEGRATVVEERVERTIEVEALMRAVVGQIERYAELSREVPDGAAEAVRQIDDPARLADAVAYSPDLSFRERQELPGQLDPVARLRWATAYLTRQLEILEVRERIQGEVRKAAENNQREFLLREQMKAIQKELGERGGQAEVGDELRQKIEAAGMPDEVKEKALRELERMEALPSAS